MISSISIEKASASRYSTETNDLERHLRFLSLDLSCLTTCRTSVYLDRTETYVAQELERCPITLRNVEPSKIESPRYRGLAFHL
jgi:hypothetical protein